MFKGLDTFIMGMMVILIIAVPLAIWKLINVTIWIIQNVKITF